MPCLPWLPGLLAGAPDGLREEVRAALNTMVPPHQVKFCLAWRFRPGGLCRETYLSAAGGGRAAGRTGRD